MNSAQSNVVRSGGARPRHCRERVVLLDRAYLAHEVAYHKAVIDAINQTLLPAIKNAELKAFVLKVAPAFQGHLAAAQKLAEKYGATS